MQRQRYNNGFSDTVEGVWLHLLPRDIVWGHFAPADIGALHWWVCRLVTRLEGMNIYFTLVDPTHEKFPVTPAPTAPNTPAPNTPISGTTPLPSAVNTPAPSRPHSPTQETEDEHNEMILKRATRDTTPRRRNVGTNHRPHSPSPLHTALSRHFHSSLSRPRHWHNNLSSVSHDNNMHFSLWQLAHSLVLTRITTESTEGTVGVFESQRYLALESTRLSHAGSPALTEQFTELLNESCDRLLETCQGGMLSVLRLHSKPICFS